MKERDQGSDKNTIPSSLRSAVLFAAAVVLAGSASQASASAIVGGWYGTHLGQADSTAAFDFLANGTYVQVEDGNSILDPSGHNGMERGTYTWDPTSGTLTVTSVSIDTSGQWGLNDGSMLPPFVVGTASIVGNSLTGTTPDGTFVLSRVFDPSNPIVSSWLFTNNPNQGDITVLTFLPDGHFLEGIDPPTGGYMLYGTFTSNPMTGAFDATIIDSTVPGAPFNGFPFDPTSFSSAVVVGDQLIVTGANGQPFTLTNASVPEPATLTLLGLGLAGLAASRRRKLT